MSKYGKHLDDLWKDILDKQKGIEGHTGLYFKNMITGEERGFNENDQFFAASIVKLPLLMAMMNMRQKRETDFSEKIVIHDYQKIPGCGAVKSMTGDVTLDINSLYKLMITLSDNTATNALFRHYGAERISQNLKELGFEGTQFNRQYYDFELEYAGINNFFVPKEMGSALERMYKRTLIGWNASQEMEDILSLQQINHKMCGRIPEDEVRIAHKTGEEDGTTHDVGLVYAKEPFVICFASNITDVPKFEDFIRETTYLVYQTYNQ